MTSLLERMDIEAPTPTPARGSGGPVRNRGSRPGSAPYNRAFRSHGKADADATWVHDKYNGPDTSLSSRLTDTDASQVSAGPPKVDSSGAEAALRKAMGLATTRGGDISIKGASTSANVVEVSGLLSGTTAADVEAIFKQCGPILKSYVHSSRDAEDVVVRLTFKKADDAKTAVSKFNKQSADGKVLRVTIVGSANATLSGRLGTGISHGSVDDLMDEDLDSSRGSKLRSDEIIRSDPRAQILTMPPGSNPADYQTPRGPRGGGSWRRGRGGRGRGHHGGGRGQQTNKMETD